MNSQPSGGRPPLQARLDHLVVAGSDLRRSSEFVEDLLGVPSSPGGKHQSQGTHNRLIRLGTDQYLEIICIDPDGEAPSHPRWFDLDDPGLRSKISKEPKLITWAININDLQPLDSIFPYSGCEFERLQRGDLHWRAALTPGGHLLAGGLLPLAIEWCTPSTPPQRLPDSGCKLLELCLCTPDVPALESVLKTVGLTTPVKITTAARAYLRAVIETPTAEVELCS